VTTNHTYTAKYDDPAFQDVDGYPYCVGTELLKALHHYYVPTDDQTSMNVKQIFEKQIQSFPGIPNSASVDAFEKWANNSTLLPLHPLKILSWRPQGAGVRV
jgi:hypothetical protein